MKLKYGAYAFVDGLGMSGYLQGDYWEDYIRGLDYIESDINAFIDKRNMADHNADSAYIASDAFLITHSAWRVSNGGISTPIYDDLYQDAQHRLRQISEVEWNLIRLKLLGEVLSRLVTLSTIDNYTAGYPMLALRGSIALGNGYFAARRWAGPAPLEAIKSEREVEAALIVTTASATSKLDSIIATYDESLKSEWWNHLDNNGCPRNFLRTKVPIKNPNSKVKEVRFEDRYVLNPFWGHSNADAISIQTATISAMGANDEPNKEPKEFAKRWYTQCIMDQMLAQTDVNYQRYLH